MWGLNEAATNGLAAGCVLTEVVAPLNRLFVELVQHSPEDPAKAQIDVDAGHVACRMAQLLTDESQLPAPRACVDSAAGVLDCTSDRAYRL